MMKGRGVQDHRRTTIPSLRTRFSREPPRHTPPTKEQIAVAEEEGAIWSKMWLPHPTKVGRKRLTYVKTTPKRQETAENLWASRGNDRLLVEKGRASSVQWQKVAKSGVNLSPWLYGGLSGRYQSVFGSKAPIGQEYVKNLESLVKENRKKGKTTHLLDVGAGIAQHWSPVLRRLRKYGDVELHVLNPSHYGKYKSPADHWHIGSIEQYNFRRKKFDGIVSTYGGFDKTNHPLETLNKMAKLTAPGGYQYLIFGRKELGKDGVMTKQKITSAIEGTGKDFSVTHWKEPTGPRKNSKKAYRKDLMFRRAR